MKMNEAKMLALKLCEAVRRLGSQANVLAGGFDSGGVRIQIDYDDFTRLLGEEGGAVTYSADSDGVYEHLSMSRDGATYSACRPLKLKPHAEVVQ